MSEKTKTQKKRLVQRASGRVRKVIWPDKITLARKTAAVVATSVFVGALIAVIDAIFKIRNRLIGEISRT